MLLNCYDLILHDAIQSEICVSAIKGKLTWFRGADNIRAPPTVAPNVHNNLSVVCFET